MSRLVGGATHRYFAAMPTPGCYGNFASRKLLCQSCYVRKACREQGPEPEEDVEKPTITEGVTGSISADLFDLSLTLYSGQTFRWGRDTDGWWKGIAFGVALHLKQEKAYQDLLENPRRLLGSTRRTTADQVGTWR